MARIEKDGTQERMASRVLPMKRRLRTMSRQVTKEEMVRDYGSKDVDEMELEARSEALEAGCEPESYQYWVDFGAYVVCIADGREFTSRGERATLRVRRNISARIGR